MGGLCLSKVCLLVYSERGARRIVCPLRSLSPGTLERGARRRLVCVYVVCLLEKACLSLCFVSKMNT